MTELYKYRSFNEYSLECILENVIWISKPEHFNDPFEYSFRIDADMPLVEVLKRKDDATQKNYLEKQLELIGHIKEKFEVGGVFSLSKSSCISLMWSHYANSHYGFCVGYGVNSSNDLGNGKCKSVSYEKYESFSLMEMWRGIEKNDYQFAKKMFRAMILAKDPNWKYEQEKRVLYTQSDQLIIPNFNIISITFGLRMPESHKKIILRLMEGKGINFFKVIKIKAMSPLNVENHQVLNSIAFQG